MNIIKLDKRYKGSDKWKYLIELFGPAKSSAFHEVRAWCWQTWGPSKELDDWLKDSSSELIHNEHWCWKNDQYVYRRIYLREDAEFIVAKLRWL